MINEINFRNFLYNQGITVAGIETRISRAYAGEKILGYTFEEAISSDEKMYKSLIKLKPYENPKKNPMQNSLRKYYLFKYGKEFPRLSDYERANH